MEADRYLTNAALDTVLLAHLGSLQLGDQLRAAELEVVRHTASFLERHGNRTGHGTAFVLVYALRGALVAAAACEPELLLSPPFRRRFVELAQLSLV